jgi:drug/metabolite transporter (DMT)-like permease
MTGSELLLVATATLLIGSADFFGGIASRKSAPLAIASWSQAAGVPVVLVVALVVGGSLGWSDLGLGVVAGLGSALGVGVMYRGFSIAAVGVVAPIASATAAVVPIAIGLASGERPSALVLAGVVLAVVAIMLVGYMPSDGDVDRRGVGYGVVAGIGFGAMVIAYAATSPDSGVWSVVVGRSVAAAAAGVAVVVTGVRWAVDPSVRIATVLAGVLAAVGMAAFVTASQSADLVVLGVALGLFPTVTAILAAVVLRERLRATQWSGIATAAIAIAMISVG